MTAEAPNPHPSEGPAPAPRNVVHSRVNPSIPGTTVRFGDRARDSVTGYTGIVTGHSRHLTGCDTVWLEQPPDEKGETRGRWLDVNRVVLVERAAVEIRPIPDDVPAAG